MKTVLILTGILLIVLIVTGLGWLIYQVRIATPVEDEVDELLEHLYGKDKND